MSMQVHALEILCVHNLSSDKRCPDEGITKRRSILTIWGVRLKVRPLTSVGIRLTQVLGTAMLRGSVFTRPWSSTWVIAHECQSTVQLHSTLEARELLLASNLRCFNLPMTEAQRKCRRR